MFQETHPESGTTTFLYSDDGTLSQKTDANNSVFGFEYDAAGRLTDMTVAGRHTHIDYEVGSSNPSHVATQDSVTDLEYDAVGNVLSRQDAIDGMPAFPRALFTYDYTRNNGLQTMTYPSGRSILYDLDVAGRPTAVTDAVTNVAYASGLSYRASGALDSYTTGNGVVHEMEYDPYRYWVTDIKASLGSTELLHLAYDQYDNVGNVKRITDPRPNMTQSFAYDHLDRLTSASGPYGTATYNYHPNGNRNDAGSSTYTYETGTLRLQAQTAGGVTDTFSYDSVGNMRFRNTDEFRYFPEGPMKQSIVAGATTDYRYDGDGWRTKKASGTNTTYYLRGPGGLLLTEWLNPGASPTYPRDYIYAGGRLIAAVRRTLDAQDTTPDAFSFTDQTSVALATAVNSNILQITGITGNVLTSISGGGGTYRICADVSCSSNPSFGSADSTITSGQYLQLRVTSSGSFATAVNVSMTVGTVSDTWSVTSVAQDTTPDAFSFNDLTDVAVNTAFGSNIVHITGITGMVATSVSSDGGGTYRICADATCSSNPAFGSGNSAIANGDYVQVQATSGPMGATVNTTLTIGTASDTWSVSSVGQDTTPDSFSFTDQTAVAIATAVNSNVLPITGISGSVNTSISGGAYRICSDASCSSNPAFGSANATITNGQYLQLRVTSSSSFSTAVSATMTVGTGATSSDTWSVTTAAQDTTPDGFSFTDVTGAALDTDYLSGVVPITGITGVVSITAGGASYRVCADVACTAGPSFTTSPGTITNGQYVQLYIRSSAAYETTVNNSLAVGTVSDTWSVTTRHNWPNMGGNWYNLNAICCEIVVDGNGEVTGFWRGGGLWPAWQDGNFIHDPTWGRVGELAEGEQTIFWSDGDAWRRTPYDPDLQGPWYSTTYDVSCWIDINGYGDAGDVWDEWGNRVFVRQSGSYIEILWSSDWGVYDGGAIYWSDGRVWVRP